MNVLIIIPAYNEEKNIESVINNLSSNYSQFDYVVVNDGSRDHTAEICKKNGYNLINLPINLGLAGAVQTGMKYASIKGYDAAIQFDGDGQHDPSYIKSLESFMELTNTDIVIGSRYVNKTKPKSLRMLGSNVIQFLIKLTTKQTITDPTSGMRLYRRNIVDEFAWNMNYSPEPDTIAYLMNNGTSVKEVPVTMSDRNSGESYLTLAHSVRYMINVCFSIIFIQWFRKRVQ